MNSTPLYDVAIVGAGIIGCSIALEFLNRDARVVVFEEHAKPFQGSSSAGFGSLTPYSDPYFRGDAQEFAAKSVELYRSKWIDEISQKAHREIPFVDLGLIELFAGNADVEKAKAHADILNSSAQGEVARILSPQDVRELEPQLLGQFAGGLLLNEPWVDKELLFASLEDILRASLGDNFRFGTTVRSISFDDHDNVQLLTDRDSSVNAKWLVTCTGLCLSSIDGLPEVPLAWIRGDAIGVNTLDDKPLLSRHVYMGNGFITPRRNGYMLLGATYEEEDGPPSEYARLNRDRISVAQFEWLLKHNQSILPALFTCDVLKSWRGWRPTPADKTPILGIVPNRPRIVVATGYIGLGITMAPATAQTIADYCLEGKNSFPLSFSPARFIDR